MEIQRFSKDMNIINSLPDQPTLTTDALKQKFDEGGKAIKDFLNGEGDYVGIGFADQIEDALEEVQDDVKEAIEGISDEINTDLYGEGGTYDEPSSDSPIGKVKTDISETKTTLESEMSELTTKVNNISVSGNLNVTVVDVGMSTETQYGSCTGQTAPTYYGWKFVGCVGWHITWTNGYSWHIKEVYASGYNTTTPTICAYGNAEPNAGNIHYACTVQVYCLWAK